MATKELIKEEIDRIKEEYLDELFEIVRQFSQAKQEKPSLMSRLKGIKIEAPEDFSANHDQYVARGQRVESDLC